MVASPRESIHRETDVTNQTLEHEQLMTREKEIALVLHGLRSLAIDSWFH